MTPGLPDSPYIIGLPISDPCHFFGRAHQIKRFFQMLRSPTLQPLRVLGLRRSGKTSFLRHVARPEIVGSQLQDNRPTIIAYVDLQAGIETPVDFYLAVAEAIACPTLSPPTPQVLETYPDFRSFRKWLKSILASSRNLRLVVLLDEFEILAQSPKFGLSFFTSLRALVTGSPGRFAWVTASSSDLYALLPEDRQTSPLFNIFHPMPIILGPLEPGEIERLICIPAKSCGVEFSPQEVRAIQDIAGAIPYFLQVVAEQWFFTRKPDISVVQCREKVLAQIRSLSQIQDRLDRYWQRLTDQEQNCLYQLALGKPSRQRSQEMEQKLLHFGLLSQDNGSLKVAGEVFRQWIKNNHSQRRYQVDPSSVAPFVPIIVEATKFVFTEAGKWIESIRKKVPDKASLPKTTLALPITQTQFSATQADLQAMAAMMDSSAAETMAYEIQGLVEQIQMHRRNLTDLETQETEFGGLVPTHVKRGIERESQYFVKKTTRLVKLLNEIYQ
jgi:hypothetical protein